MSTRPTSIPPSSPVRVEDDRTSLHPAALRRAFQDHVQFSRSRDVEAATPFDRYVALSLAVRDRLVSRWSATQRTYYEKDAKRAYYLSAEFLLGRALLTNLQALGVEEAYRAVLRDLNVDLDDLVELEPDAGLGNGGLGRLAACFMESIATLGMPGYGYGIRYEFGIFEQAIRNGAQVERADEWLRFGNPWEIERPEYSVPVRFGGHTEMRHEGQGKYQVVWHPGERIVGVPFDTPIAGYNTPHVNSLRLWAARAHEEFDFDLFNAGDYVRAVQAKNDSEVVSKVLYPNDNFEAGRELRLRQEYFFVACSIYDIVWRYKKTHPSFDHFSDKVAIQLNDTHPAIAIAELMRVLVDENKLGWDEAWEQTHAAFGYTNHTLLPEALERWPVSLFRRLLPRHLEIIHEINRRFLRTVMDAYPQDHARQRRMSIVEDGPDGNVRMAYLAVVGSHSVNGVAKLHSRLLKDELMRDFSELYPDRFNNKTNGVTPRRWLFECNPGLARLITDYTGGREWVKDLSLLEKLVPHAEEPEARARLRGVKRANKERLAKIIRYLVNVEVDPASIFDVQIKRLHEYKRQLLNVLHIVALYLRLKKGQKVTPRTFLFGAKAAPGYRMAKLIIRFIHAVQYVINGDRSNSALRVAFLPNYRVSLAEKIIPAADVSEQISTAGMEASGTGNMKLSMNGALTIGTLDGANIEIRDAVGAENFFLFGMTAEEVAARKRANIPGAAALQDNEELREVISLIESGFFNPEERDLFRPLLDELLGRDQYMIMADFAAYSACQEAVAAAYQDQDAWSRMAFLNVARMGAFSSDRTIREYAREIWGIEPIAVEAPVYHPDGPPG
ncbi:MAG: glycogen/starch/alpha-glucan phosphorylase [Polyangiaceae bacterium]